ncbi:hypothetical protein NL676_017238 [Syzygium grande]|nr:hypothetical protein NL676_017238 [Syzygium grande]
MPCLLIACSRSSSGIRGGPCHVMLDPVVRAYIKSASPASLSHQTLSLSLSLSHTHTDTTPTKGSFSLFAFLLRFPVGVLRASSGSITRNPSSYSLAGKF